eukprot:Ihof_evm2s516 gene=Ihof_evmTU2s516
MYQNGLFLGALYATLLAGVWGRVHCPVYDIDVTDASNYCTQMKRERGGALVPGTLCLLMPEQVHPTQLAVGKAACLCHRLQLENFSAEKLKKYLQKNPVPSIIGPGGKVYITDKHHLSYAMFEATLSFDNPIMHRPLYACIQQDWAHMEVVPFWQKMEATGNCFLFDERGQPANSTSLPPGLKQLKDDPFRTLSRYVRTGNGFIKCNAKKTSYIPQCKNSDAPFFLEFRWAELLRSKLPVMRDTTEPQIRPHDPNFIYSTNFQSQVTSLTSYLPL